MDRLAIDSPSAISVVTLELVETLDGFRGIHVLLQQGDFAAVLRSQLFIGLGGILCERAKEVVVNRNAEVHLSVSLTRLGLAEKWPTLYIRCRASETSSTPCAKG